jgi:chromate transporter
MILSRPATEVFVAFLRLGLTSFGGPIAHLGYFHREFVTRRKWFDEAQYGQLVALCQFLPGPASSQLGFLIGLLRAGWWGAVAAFTAFTAPSALLLLAFARVLPQLQGACGQAVLLALKLVAVAVVARGLLQMARRLTPDAPRVFIAVAAMALILYGGTSLAQLIAVAGGALLGLALCRKCAISPGVAFHVDYGPRTGALLLGVFASLLALTFMPKGSLAPMLEVSAAFYRVGAWVFGGGHVVLPLLQEAVVQPGYVSADDFLAGYGAAQAVPGPLFSVAVFLGARVQAAQPLLMAACCLMAIFLPGLLLAAGALPFWKSLSAQARAVHALAGVNAAVVGVLAAALYDLAVSVLLSLAGVWSGVS